MFIFLFIAINTLDMKAPFVRDPPNDNPTPLQNTPVELDFSKTGVYSDVLICLSVLLEAGCSLKVSRQF